jgi:hypothetical protein
MVFYALSRVARMGEPAQFALSEDDRDYHFYFATKKALRRLEIQYGSTHGDYELKLGFFDIPGFDETTRGEIRTRILDVPPPYAWKGLNLYRATVRLDKRSAVQTSVNPYVLGFRPVR